VLLLAFQANAGTTYYVDFSTGSDTNNGTSVSTAWEHCPGDVNATASAGSTNLQLGDTVVFKGGVEYDGTINLNWSGSSDTSRIIYDGNSAGTWGTGKAIIDGQNKRTRGIGTDSSRNYVTINNFEVRNLADGSLVYAVYFNRSNTGITVKNCYLHENGQWNNNAGISGVGIRLVSPTNAVVDNNEITKCGETGIEFSGGTNSTISNNKLHSYIRWAIDINSDASEPSGHLISRNTIYDLYYYDTDYWQGGGEPPHTDFIFMRSNGPGTQIPHHITIERNLFYNNASFGNSHGGTAFIYDGSTEGSWNLIIRNNIFINPHSYAGVSLTGNAYDCEIYNNIFYTERPNCNAFGFPTHGTKFKNNIIVSSDLVRFHQPATVDWQVDYNYYYTSAPPKPFTKDNDSSTYTFMEWKSTYSHDLHSTMAASIAAIKFLSTTGYPTSCNTMDLRLQPDSPAVNNGIAISGFSDDYVGTARPQGAGWDIGAYEFTREGSPPAPPKGLKIVP
jgi:parallel beta-helix repeat protein